MIKQIIDFLLSLFSGQAKQQKPHAAQPVPEKLPANKLSPNFYIAEFTRSSTAIAKGINNEPTPEHLKNLRHTAAQMEFVRYTLGNNPIIISSGYRSKALNDAVGGSKTSDHANGLAVDFTCPAFGSVKQVCEAIIKSGLVFDQIIYEQGATKWVHLGFGDKNRRHVMSWSPNSGYVPGLKDLK